MYLTNIAVLSELGLFPLSLCTIKTTINYLLHLLSANANSLIYYSYQEHTLRKDGLCSKIKLLLAEIGFNERGNNPSSDNTAIFVADL
jgi:hypothetical protein